MASSGDVRVIRIPPSLITTGVFQRVTNIFNVLMSVH
jgi:hypothetical protein